MRSRLMSILMIMSILGMPLVGCTKSQENQTIEVEDSVNTLQEDDTTGRADGTTEPVQPSQEISEPHPYISITYGRSNPEMPLGREIVFYTYDLVDEELNEICALPFNAKYASGVVSLENQMVYYSSRMNSEDLSSDDCLWAYDLNSGESIRLEHENFSYNDIAIIDSNTLLVMAVKAGDAHVITPALFDLTTNTFTYLPDVNAEPLTQYSTGPSPMNYNYRTGQFCYIYRNQEEMYWPEYLGMREPIDVHIALVGADLTKQPKNTYTAQWKSTQNVDWLTQVTDNTMLIQMYTEVIDPENPTLDNNEMQYYTITFGGENAVLEPAAPPFPDAASVNLMNCQTFDGGKTYYLKMNRVGDTSGLFSYSAETGELQPILLNNDAEENHVINFSAVGP